jgi:predicted RNA binding protein YcfA (HicA-like mRNA interferase family)
MSQWPSAKAKRVLAALLKLGWETRRQAGSHRTLMREG